MPNTQIVLPARLASTRLPEKLLQKVGGKSVLQHTFEAASRARCASAGVVIAVDHDRLAREAESFGARWVMTPENCPSGTDRVAYVANRFSDVEVFVNVQSDEPEIDPQAIDTVAEALISDPTADIATAGTAIRDPQSLHDPSIVKIVLATSDDHHGGAINGTGAGQGRAVYFSRACVPFVRDGDPADKIAANPPIYWHHLGLYAYRREFLNWFSVSPPSLLEQTEKLEQLRAIEAGKKIVVAAVGPAKSGIDTPEDLAGFRKRIES